MALFSIHHAATDWRAAAAGNTRQSFSIGVIGEEFPARANPAAAEEKNVPPAAANGKVRIAAVVDELRAAWAREAVNHDAAIEASEINIIARFSLAQISPEAAVGLGESQAVACVLDYLAAFGNGLEGEDAPAVDLGTADAQAKPGALRRNRARFSEPGFHNDRTKTIASRRIGRPAPRGRQPSPWMLI